MAQQVEHFLGKEEVTGSNPVSSSRRKTTRYCGFSLFRGKKPQSRKYKISVANTVANRICYFFGGV